jgi:hypothetical protein
MMKYVTFLIFSLLSFNTIAGNFWCSGTLEYVYVNKSGEVTIKGSWGPAAPTSICSTKNSEAVDTITCSLWASYAVTAVKNKMPVVLMYSEENLTCSTLPTYGDTPPPFYFMLKAS